MGDSIARPGELVVVFYFVFSGLLECFGLGGCEVFVYVDWSFVLAFWEGWDFVVYGAEVEWLVSLFLFHLIFFCVGCESEDDLGWSFGVWLSVLVFAECSENFVFWVEFYVFCFCYFFYDMF